VASALFGVGCAVESRFHRGAAAFLSSSPGSLRASESLRETRRRLPESSVTVLTAGLDDLPDFSAPGEEYSNTAAAAVADKTAKAVADLPIPSEILYAIPVIGLSYALFSIFTFDPKKEAKSGITREDFDYKTTLKPAEVPAKTIPKFRYLRLRNGMKGLLVQEDSAAYQLSTITVRDMAWDTKRKVPLLDRITSQAIYKDLLDEFGEKVQPGEDTNPFFSSFTLTADSRKPTERFAQVNSFAKRFLATFFADEVVASEAEDILETQEEMQKDDLQRVQNVQRLMALPDHPYSESRQLVPPKVLRKEGVDLTEEVQSFFEAKYQPQLMSFVQISNTPLDQQQNDFIEIFGKFPNQPSRVPPPPAYEFKAPWPRDRRGKMIKTVPWNVNENFIELRFLVFSDPKTNAVAQVRPWTWLLDGIGERKNYFEEAIPEKIGFLKDFDVEQISNHFGVIKLKIQTSEKTMSDPEKALREIFNGLGKLNARVEKWRSKTPPEAEEIATAMGDPYALSNQLAIMVQAGKGKEVVDSSLMRKWDYSIVSDFVQGALTPENAHIFLGSRAFAQEADAGLGGKGDSKKAAASLLPNPAASKSMSGEWVKDERMKTQFKVEKIPESVSAAFQAGLSGGGVPAPAAAVA